MEIQRIEAFDKPSERRTSLPMELPAAAMQSLVELGLAVDRAVSLGATGNH